jgi:hypothetical protein
MGYRWNPSRNRHPKARDHRDGPRIRVIGSDSFVARSDLAGTGLPRSVAIFDAVGLGSSSARIIRGKIWRPSRLFSGGSVIRDRTTPAKGGRTPTWLRDEKLSTDSKSERCTTGGTQGLSRIPRVGSHKTGLWAPAARGSVHRGLVQTGRGTTDLDEVTKDVLDLVRVLDDRKSLQFGLA